MNEHNNLLDDCDYQPELDPEIEMIIKLAHPIDDRIAFAKSLPDEVVDWCYEYIISTAEKRMLLESFYSKDYGELTKDATQNAIDRLREYYGKR